MGGFMASSFSHNVGGPMGGDGLPLVNWSTKIGDLRVGHFIGMHALQIIPFIGFLIEKKRPKHSSNNLFVWAFSVIYFSIICFSFHQAFTGKPFIAIP